MLKPTSSLSSLAFATFISLGTFSSVFAQGVFEGSGETDDSAPSCVGDGCGIEYPNAQQESLAQDNPSDQAGSTEGSQGMTAEDSGDGNQEKATAQDSAKVAHMDDEEDSRDHYVTESHSDYQARKEGFTKRIQFGGRIAGGTNIAFGDNDGWNLGIDVAGGIFARMPIVSGLSVVSGLEFGYRQYNYDGKTDFSKDEATISQMIFDIPVILQYAFDEDGLFFGFGTDIQLKMQGESEFIQVIDKDKVHTKDKRNNTLPSTGVEVGLTANLGYAITSWCQVDLRATFNFTNLLDLDVIAESALMESDLHLLHINAGLTFLL